jgi:hypothetical protein
MILLQTEQSPHAPRPVGHKQFKYWARSNARVHLPIPAGPAKIIACGKRFCSMARLNISTGRALPRNVLRFMGDFM